MVSTTSHGAAVSPSLPSLFPWTAAACHSTCPGILGIVLSIHRGPGRAIGGILVAPTFLCQQCPCLAAPPWHQREGPGEAP